MRVAKHNYVTNYNTTTNKGAHYCNTLLSPFDRPGSHLYIYFTITLLRRTRKHQSQAAHTPTHCFFD
jgi:hypothetical protein